METPIDVPELVLEDSAHFFADPLQVRSLKGFSGLPPGQASVNDSEFVDKTFVVEHGNLKGRSSEPNGGFSLILQQKRSFCSPTVFYVVTILIGKVPKSIAL